VTDRQFQLHPTRDGDLTVDVSEVTYCDSAAIRAVYAVVEQARITLIVSGSGPIATLLRITGLDQVTTVTAHRCCVGEQGEVPHDRGLGELPLGREVPEHGAESDAVPARDLLGRTGLAGLAEDLLGRGQHPIPVGLRVASHPAISPCNRSAYSVYSELPLRIEG
jgi:hypothetical protein